MLLERPCDDNLFPEMGCKPISILVSFSASIFFGYYGFRLVNLYFRTKSWQRTSSKLRTIKDVTAAKTFYEVITLDWSTRKCSITYNYTVGSVVYYGTDATLDSRLGAASLCSDLRKDLKFSLTETYCFYDPKSPSRSALQNKFPTTAMGVCIVVSFLNVAVLTSLISAYLVFIPTLYGLISGGILLAIAVQLWPKKDAVLVAALILVILPIFGPASRRCRRKQNIPNQ